MPPRFVAKQLAHPRGLLGKVVARRMNRLNSRINAIAIGQLMVTSSDRVLEVGFGGGGNLPTLIARAAFVAGIDRSADIVAYANSRHAIAIEEDRAEFHVASVDAVPFKTGYFTRICTIDTIYFWKNLVSGFREILRVLAPNGRLVVAFLPKCRMDLRAFPSDIFIARGPEEVALALQMVGFRCIRSALIRDSMPWQVIIAER